MKKILAILALASAVTIAHAQGGTVFLNNSSYPIATNSTAIGGSIGVTTPTTGTFTYALLIADYGGPMPSSDPLNLAWSDTTLIASNGPPILPGRIIGLGSGNSIAVGWGAPTGPSYTDGQEKYFMIVGWSTSYATTWAAFAPMLQAGLAPGGFYGTSDIGYGFSGGGPAALPPSNLFGISPGMPGGLTSGFQLYAVVPEPASIGLVSLGGLAMLYFRRKT